MGIILNMTVEPIARPPGYPFEIVVPLSRTRVRYGSIAPTLTVANMGAIGTWT
jgi:hypothetical protein